MDVSLARRIDAGPRTSTPEPLRLRRGPVAAATVATRMVLLVGSRLGEDRASRDAMARGGLRLSTADGLAQARRFLSQLVFDAVVLDIGGCVPPLARAVSEMRRSFDGALLVVGEQGSDLAAAEVDEIVALELGADDYVGAPVSARRLQARLRALLRPARAAAQALPVERDDGLEVAGWRLDMAQQRLRREDRAVALTAGQVELLQCLVRHAGQVVPRSAVQRQVCRGGTLPDSRSIDVYVHRLRRRLRDEGVSDIRIEAVRGRGFVLSAG